MVMPLVSLGLALSKVNTLATTGSSAISSMSNLVSTIGDAFGKAFSWAIEKARDAFNFIRDVWNDRVKPIFQPISTYLFSYGIQQLPLLILQSKVLSSYGTDLLVYFQLSKIQSWMYLIGLLILIFLS